MKMEEIIEKYVCSPSAVAVAGASPKEERAVHGVMEYLKEEGFRLFPVNPSYAGEDIQGLLCLGSITEVGEKFDILGLFISPDRQRPVLEDLDELGYKPIIWMQPGAENDAAEAALKARGYEVVKGACLMMVHEVYCEK